MLWKNKIKIVVSICLLFWLIVENSVLAQNNPFLEDAPAIVQPPITTRYPRGSSTKDLNKVPESDDKNQNSKPPAPKPIPHLGGKSLTAAHPEFKNWFAESVAILKDVEFPNLKNKYGEKITIENFFKAIIWIESNGIHKTPRGKILKSPAGAIGFAQLMPTTARIFVKDPTDPRQNLIAGAKYVKEIMSSHTIKTISDPQEKLIMTIAAYNLGPYSKHLKRGWETIKIKGPRETAAYGLKLKMSLGLPLSASEKILVSKYLGVDLANVDEVANEYYARTHGL